jgi:hypothetical protein
MSPLVTLSMALVAPQLSAAKHVSRRLRLVTPAVMRERLCIQNLSLGRSRTWRLHVFETV